MNMRSDPESTTLSPDGTSALGAAPDSGASAEEIEADIARTREQLGHTVEALSSRLDVKSRVRDKLRAAKRRVTDRGAALRGGGRQHAASAMAVASDDQGRPKPAVPAAGAALAAMGAAVVGYALWQRFR